MKPRYEIHSIGMPEVVSQHSILAARALFAATEMVNTNRFETEVGRNATATKYREYMPRYYRHYQSAMQPLAASLNRLYERQPDDLTKLMDKLIASGAPEARDAWGNTLRIEPANWNSQRQYRVFSAGPDRKFGTADDLTGFLAVHPGNTVDTAPSEMKVRIEHDRGPFNGLAEIAGTASDQTGAGLNPAKIEARDVASGTTRTTGTNPMGQFSLAGLPPGTYEFTISAPGFKSVSQDLTLAVRDHAVIAAILVVGPVAQSVTLAAIPQRIRVGGNVQGEFMAGMGGARFAVANGTGVVGGTGLAAGGILGGLLGGVPVAAPPLPPIKREEKAAVPRGENPAPLVSAPTSPKPSTSTRESSPTAMAAPPSPSPSPIPSPPGAWRSSPPPRAAPSAVGPPA